MNHSSHGAGQTGKPQRPMFDQDASSGGHSRPMENRQTYTRSAAQPHRSDSRVGAGGRAYTYRNQEAPRSMASGAVAVARPTRASRRKKKALRRIGVIALALVLVLIIGVVSLYAYVANQINAEATEAGVLPDDVKTLPEYTGQGIIHLLVCGIDYNNDEADGYQDPANKNGNTDMILYVVYDTVNNKVTLAQFPRDLYVGNGVNAGVECKINGLYPHSEDPDNRMAPLAKVFKEQFGLPVDNYVTIDMDGVKALIELICANKGSLPVYVPIDVDYTDPDTGEYSVMKAGWRDFTAEEANYFLRNRKSSTYNQQGDIMRLQMQQCFYSALFREFKSLSGSDLLPWVKILLYYCKTDMDPLQLGGLAQKALNLQGSDLTFVRPAVSGAALEIPGREKPASLLSLVPEDAADLFNQYLRPEGYTMSVEELDIYTLPVVESIGTVPAAIRTMADIQAEEPPREE